MGMDKATLEVGGIPQAERIVQELTQAGYPVTVVGKHPIAGCEFVCDVDEFPGPLAALGQFEPARPKVAVLACDMPLFRASFIQSADSCLSDSFDAAIPEIGGKLQPLAALYRAQSWTQLHHLASQGEKRLMAWIATLQVHTIEESEIAAAGISPSSLMGANNPDELRFLLAERHGIPS